MERSKAGSRAVHRCIAHRLLSRASASGQWDQASSLPPRTALPISRAAWPRSRLFLPLDASVLPASSSAIAAPAEVISPLSRAGDAASPESRQACAPVLPARAPVPPPPRSVPSCSSAESLPGWALGRFLPLWHHPQHQEPVAEQASSSFSFSSFSGPTQATVAHRPHPPAQHSGAGLRCFRRP